MNIEAEHLTTAYKKLKRLVYFDKTDLSLRKRLAEFENDPSFDKKLLLVGRVMNSDNPRHEPSFKRWLEEINFRVIPKNFDGNDNSIRDSEDTKKGRFISNVSSAKEYKVEKVNYFFDGPIELQLIAVLWIMFEGYILDSQLGEECYGSRLEAALRGPDDSSSVLYRKYHELYVKWRDRGIQKAKQLLTDEQTSVFILGLDLQEFYYRSIIDYRAIARTVYEADIKENDQKDSKSTPSKLLRCLKVICLKYREKIDPFLRYTHPDIPPKAGLPIGLCSSPLLANWHLRKFDNAIKSLVRPSYYGRYVDDILLVIPAPEDPADEEDPVESFMDRILVKTHVLDEPKDSRYKITEYEDLFLQQRKCILQYFDTKHSIAGLEKFQKKLEENASAFLLMPVDEADNSLEDVAYDLLYEGSTNKFRSVKGMIENRYELAKHLAKQTILHMLTDDPPDLKISLGLRKFFKGKNAIEFHDLWERVLTFFLIAEDAKASKAFVKHLHSEIKRVKHDKVPSITKRLTDNLETHLMLCIEMTHALTDPGLLLADSSQVRNENAFIYANLIRHHFVRLPLLNYTDFSGSLTTRSIEEKVKADFRKLKLSPRFVNFDECLMLAASGNIKLAGQSVFQWACEIYKTINNDEVESIEWDFALTKEEGRVQW